MHRGGHYSRWCITAAGARSASNAAAAPVREAGHAAAPPVPAGCRGASPAGGWPALPPKVGAGLLAALPLRRRACAPAHAAPPKAASPAAPRAAKRARHWGCPPAQQRQQAHLPLRAAPARAHHAAPRQTWLRQLLPSAPPPRPSLPQGPPVPRLQPPPAQPATPRQPGHELQAAQAGQQGNRG